MSFCESPFAELQLRKQCLEFISINSMMHFNCFITKQAERYKAWLSWRMSRYHHSDISVVGRNGCYVMAAPLCKQSSSGFQCKRQVKNSTDSITFIQALFTWSFRIIFLACPSVVFRRQKRLALFEEVDTKPAVHAFVLYWKQGKYIFSVMQISAD